ncbi:MAG: DUF3150 domain-containing protein [Desulfobacterales bacterium]|nr:DUF3150 domain-containing protein [Desulfobacterales bacterium]MDD4071415.1 DUF3150 domain-containing protein [Desulfobacterales bacterium]MDD4391460.1 DUF3150 domain-containing protein [Desulfobacterales bacterium]
MSTDIKVLECIMALRLDINIWSARKKLTPSDFGTVNLPPEKLASLGSKKICNPKELRIFGTLKSRAVSLLEKAGVRFLGGWAIPEARIQDINSELELIAQDFIHEKETFLARYDEAVMEWVQNNPGWESLIAGSTVSADYVRSRLGFKWQMFKVVPPRGSKKALTATGLVDEVENLGSTLFGEIAKTASDTWHQSYVGRTEVTRKALSPLRSIHRKLAGLSFVEPRVAPVVDLLDTALNKISSKGKIAGAELVMLQGLVSLLSDPVALVEHGQKIIEGQTADGILQGLLRQSVMPVVEAASDMDIGDDIMTNIDALIPASPTETQLDSLGLW